MNFRKPLIYLSKYVVYSALSPLYFLPEGGLKRNVRKIVLKFQNSVPVFLAVNRGEIAVQVGTPRSLTVSKFSHSVGPNGKAIIIEADTENQNTIRKAINRLKHKNTILIPMGAWSKQDQLKLQQSEGYSGDHKIPIAGITYDGDSRNEYSNFSFIDVDTLSNLLKLEGIDRFDYLSITVNGAEMEVLKGAREIIEKSPSCRIFSKGHSLSSDGSPLNLEISTYLQDLGFTSIISKGEKPVDPGLKRRAGDVFAWK